MGCCGSTAYVPSYMVAEYAPVTFVTSREPVAVDSSDEFSLHHLLLYPWTMAQSETVWLRGNEYVCL